MYLVNENKNINSHLEVNKFLNLQFDLQMEKFSENIGMSECENFSPCHTRSGRVYESIERKKRRLRRSLLDEKPLTLRPDSRQSNDSCSSSDFSSSSSSPDSSDEGFEIRSRLSQPPFLNYKKEPVSLFSQVNNSFSKSWRCQSKDRMTDISIQSPSPPTNAVNAMRLFDSWSNSSSSISSSSSVPRTNLLATRLLFNDNNQERRASAPIYPGQFPLDQDSSKKNKTANINPFTPSAMIKASQRQSKRKSSISSWESEDSSSDASEDESGPSPNKRVRVSDVNITRYEQEFLEIEEIASGEFGTVKKARHCLDGMVYAIKVTKNPIKDNSRDERVAMNEIFAHSALMKHKNIVRYYNSWAEDGKLYIQNEFCQGGSLAQQIEEARKNKRFFTEGELKQLTSNIGKGLNYIHSKQLVHLDIKPENIFISSQESKSCKSHQEDKCSDSGASLGDDLEPVKNGIQYKIGDLGHVAPVYGGEMSPEEGDCRYMAPEFLEMEMDRSHLSKADIFSLGLSLYEAASLKLLPRNSMDDGNYENIKKGNLPYLSRYSQEFNNLLRSMVNPDPRSRPSAAKIMAGNFLNPGLNKSSVQLYNELRETKEKLHLLEQQLMCRSD